MTDRYRSSGENGDMFPAMRIAGFLIAHDVTIEGSNRDDGIDDYAFILHPNDGRMEEISFVLYNQRNHRLVPATSDEIVRRLMIVPGLVENVISPFSDLLIKTNGDFDADEFNPIHEALDK